MKRFSYVAALLLPLLAACGGGGSSTTGSLPQSVTAPLGSLSQSRALSEAQSDSMRQPQYTSSPADLLYVGNVGNNSITVYHHDQQGNTSPIYVISGSKTGIDAPGQLSEDAQGNLYVANGAFFLPQSTRPAILVFAHGANGNVAPIRKLAGPLTRIHNVDAMTVDKSTGELFVFEHHGNYQQQGSISLLRFPPAASGNTAPIAHETALLPAIQLASDSTGKNLIEAHMANGPNSIGLGVETLVKQFKDLGGPPPVYDTYYFGVGGVADDPTTRTYLATDPSSGGIYRLAENTVGNGPDGPGQTFAPPPVSIITSDTCGTQLALGYLRNIYVTHNIQLGACPTEAVYVYTHDSSGDVPPLRILSGSATKLNQPYGIYEGQ